MHGRFFQYVVGSCGKIGGNFPTLLIFHAGAGII